ncbi:hypothetical protein EU546_00285, partial [Candidatus Thorarchaeota archaeon]
MGADSRRITLRLREDDLEIEIHLDKTENLEEAYLEILSVQSRLRGIRRKHQLYQVAELLREASADYWEETGEGRRIDERLEAPLRIALSYLESYPESRQGSVVATEARCSSATVTQYVRGNLGEHSRFFDKCNGEWK